jgi:hypothetical protein
MSDHVVVFGERHLRHVLLFYMHYYESARTHLSQNKYAPLPRAVQAVGRILPADYTIIMFEFDFRQEQPVSGATDRKETVGLRYRIRLAFEPAE